MDEIIKEVAEKLNIEESVVSAVVKDYFKEFKNVITKVRYNTLTSFEGIKTNVLIPGFGRLIVSKNKKDIFKRKQDGKSKEM